MQNCGTLQTLLLRNYFGGKADAGAYMGSSMISAASTPTYITNT